MASRSAIAKLQCPHPEVSTVGTVTSKPQRSGPPARAQARRPKARSAIGPIDRPNRGSSIWSWLRELWYLAMLSTGGGRRGGSSGSDRRSVRPQTLSSQEAVRVPRCLWDLARRRVYGSLQSRHGASRPQSPGLCPDAQGWSEGKEWRNGE